MVNIKSIAIIISWISSVLLLATFSRNFFPKQKELNRKIVHIGTGPIIPLAWWLGIPSKLAIPVASLITIALVINRQFRLIPAIEEVNRQSFGTVAYGFSITFLMIFLWSEHPSAVSAGVLVMAFGDGFAGLIGRKFKSPSWLIFGQRKSVAGTITMGCVGLLTLILVQLISGLSINPLLLIAIASLAVILEQVSRWGIDNITVPIGVAYSWIWINS